MSHLVGPVDHLLQVASLPHVNSSTECTRVRNVVRRKGQTQHGLDLARLAKHPLMAIQGVTAQRPELDVLHAAADDSIRLVLVKLNVKYLKAMARLDQTTCLLLDYKYKKLV